VIRSGCELVHDLLPGRLDRGPLTGDGLGVLVAVGLVECVERGGVGDRDGGALEQDDVVAVAEMEHGPALPMQVGGLLGSGPGAEADPVAVPDDQTGATCGRPSGRVVASQMSGRQDGALAVEVERCPKRDGGRTKRSGPGR